MTTLDNFQNLINNTNIIITDVTDSSVIVNLSHTEYHILKTELDYFFEIDGSISCEPETSIFFPGHYEHLIETHSPVFNRRFIRDRDGDLILTSQDGCLTTEISLPSIFFILNILKTVDFEMIRRRIMIMNSMQRERFKEKETPHLKEAFRRLLTIKTIATTDSPYFNKKGKLINIAESSLFHFSYGYGTGSSLSQSWERTIYRLNSRRREIIQFPRRTYNSDLISYYQLALSSDSLMLGYLALYKILEYFFPSAAEAELHKRLAEKIIAPEFSHTKVSQLRQLTTIVKKHDQKMDEQRMLSTVIEHYFSPDEIVVWINDYEEASEHYYTNSQSIFGQSHIFDTNPDKVASSLANRIYHIRNVIVHNKEGEKPRFIPFSGQERVLSKEIPVILFLAEQLILKTGENL